MTRRIGVLRQALRGAGRLEDAEAALRRALEIDPNNSAALGNLGDCEPIGEGVSEMRVHFGPGYRIYFTRSGTTIYVLLTGGDKGSQKRDIARAKLMARELRDKSQ